jgi:hypothetical protein
MIGVATQILSSLLYKVHSLDFSIDMLFGKLMVSLGTIMTMLIVLMANW